MPKKKNTFDRVAHLQKMAEEPNFRGVFCNVAETYAVSDVIRWLDQGLRRLRNRLMISVPMETAAPLLDKTMRTICELEECTKAVAAATDMQWYKTPRGISRLRESMGISDGNRSDGKQPSEAQAP